MKLISLLAAFLAATAALTGAPALSAGKQTIGNNLQTWGTVALSEPAPADGVEITLTSKDPSRLLLAKMPDEAGSASIRLKVKARFRESPEFWLQALGDSGEVSYTATAPGFDTGTGTVSLTPSGVIVMGPHGEHGPPEFVTTPRGWPTKITFRTVQLDSSLKPVQSQYVRGGHSVRLEVPNSNPASGVLNPAQLSIPAAADTAVATFQPTGAGKTTLSVKPPAGFREPAALRQISATVRTPGIAVCDDMVIGENLQLAAAISLGEPAPEGGVTITVTSNDPTRLLLSSSATQAGQATLRIPVPAGAVTATYYLQSLSKSGKVTHVATAPGYAARTGELTLAPSGVILMLEKHGPPDEAELFRPDSAGSHRNLFVATLSEPDAHPLVVYTAWLDPKSRRSADVTVQPLRAGMSLRVSLKNANPSVARVESPAVIAGGSDRVQVPLKPVKVGETVISLLTPEGFTTPTNATELLAIVRD